MGEEWAFFKKAGSTHGRELILPMSCVRVLEPSCQLKLVATNGVF